MAASDRENAIRRAGIFVYARRRVPRRRRRRRRRGERKSRKKDRRAAENQKGALASRRRGGHGIRENCRRRARMAQKKPRRARIARKRGRRAAPRNLAPSDGAARAAQRGRRLARRVGQRTPSRARHGICGVRNRDRTARPRQSKRRGKRLLHARAAGAEAAAGRQKRLGRRALAHPPSRYSSPRATTNCPARSYSTK